MPAHQHDVGYGIHDIEAAQPAGDPQRQTLPRVFVDQREQPHGSPVMGARAHEVVAPTHGSCARVATACTTHH